MLKPYKETAYKGDDALHYSSGRYADAYLPVDYTQEDLEEALQELVWKAEQMEDAIDEADARWDDFPTQENRPSRTEYFDKRLYRRKIN